MKGTMSISLLNFKQATKDKFFLGIAFFFVLYLAFSILIGNLSVGHGDKALRNAGLVGIELTTIMLIVFSFTFSFYREKDSRILEVYFSNFRRAPCMNGKIIGYALLSLIYLLFSGLAYAGILSLYGAFDFATLTALYPIFLKTIIMICFTSIFASLFSSSTMALLSSFFIYIASEFAPSALKIISTYGAELQRKLIKILYFFLPNMDKLDIKTLTVHGTLPPKSYFLWITVYAFVYILFLWLINLCIFQRKEY